MVSEVIYYNGSEISYQTVVTRQSVVLDGKYSDKVAVISGVPQSTVLGPLLFIIYINDLPSSLMSTVKLFADDCILYRPVVHIRDCQNLQDDLSLLTR